MFIYTFAGTGPTFVFNLSTLAKIDNIGCRSPLVPSGLRFSDIYLAIALFGIGISYAIGIVLAISICAPVSGAHLSPGVTIAVTLFKGFPPLKAARYIVAQILGGFVACLIVYVQYHEQIKSLTEALEAEGVLDQINFTPQGIAGCFALYAPAGASLRYVFFNEFICVSAFRAHESLSCYLLLRQTFLLGIVIWACVDHTNFYVPTSFLPTVIGLGYAAIIWGYAPIGLAANTARDVGGRMMAVAIWGTKANGGAYAAIAALTNIFTACLSLVVYDALFVDSSRGGETVVLTIENSGAYIHLSPVVSPDHHIHLRAREAELEYRTGRPSAAIPELRGSSDKIAA